MKMKLCYNDLESFREVYIKRNRMLRKIGALVSFTPLRLLALRPTLGPPARTVPLSNVSSNYQCQVLTSNHHILNQAIIQSITHSIQQFLTHISQEVDTASNSQLSTLPSLVTKQRVSEQEQVEQCQNNRLSVLLTRSTG